MNRKVLVCFIVMHMITGSSIAQTTNTSRGEEYRPKIHFTPTGHWINDPNGMVYYKGIYHLFFQHNPESSVWGPMHWGHATSKDLIHWKREPIAIYPDSIGTIFSGSAVVDINNTSGFGKKGQVPLVAIFTQHNMVGERSGSSTYQNQSIAFSLDDGITWIKYTNNPVLRNPGIKDFRDPKVMWYESQKKWIMTLATKDCVTFYSSPDLKNWKKESEFGKEVGAHGGVWECPDLFSLDDNANPNSAVRGRKQRWVLIVNINPGGPNGGSGSQYFIGDFDGKKFTSDQKQTKWIDYGPDDYAGITWSNTGKRKIFIGWMSNWIYANKVPTETFRNAMTIARNLSLKHLNNDILIASKPVPELSFIYSKSVITENIKDIKKIDITEKSTINFPCLINLKLNQPDDFVLTMSNEMNEELVIGYDKLQNQYFIDRSKSGKTDFQKDFGSKYVAPRFATNTKMTLSLLIDVSSIELFADDGLTVMTTIFFPSKPYNHIKIRADNNVLFKRIEYISLKSIWP